MGCFGRAAGPKLWPRVFLTALLTALALADLPPPPVLCAPSPLRAEGQALLLPEIGSSAPAGPICLASDPTQCLSAAKEAGGFVCDGLCLYFAPRANKNPIAASAASELFRAQPAPGSSSVLTLASTTHAGMCIDYNRGTGYLQLYSCLNDSNQHWTYANVSSASAETSNGQLLVEAFDGAGLCVTRRADCVPEFCPKFHTILSPSLYDPSGPLQTADGTWHMWEDLGGWSHYTSRDLVHWDQTSPSSNFSGLTGSVAATGGGEFVAFWPDAAQANIVSARATDAPVLNKWVPQPSSSWIPAPGYAGKNFRDPVRAIELGGSWYVGVGCNNQSQSADLCLFQANDASLSSFSDVQPLFSVTSTFGQKDGNAVWRPEPTKATMMECPDLFAIGAHETYMVIGSLFTTNQWWIGTIAGSPPRFLPASVGLLDYGSFYAGKTGSTIAAARGDRRVLFAFSGWSNPTANPACGRAILLPRDIHFDAAQLVPLFSPVPELATLRNTSSHVAFRTGRQQQRRQQQQQHAQSQLQRFCPAARLPCTQRVASWC
eukprot:m.91108 g.91108  ORF g.91108 m.91108 type:complete len:546 (-) comp8590_c0_seq1:350-1987(-)